MGTCKYTYGCLDPSAYNFGCIDPYVPGTGAPDPAVSCAQTDNVTKHETSACTYVACMDPSAYNYPGATTPSSYTGPTQPLLDFQGNVTSISQYISGTWGSPCVYP